VFCARYREVDESNQLIQWFWQVLESFDNEERILFMRFVSGRSRLPANPADISQRFQIMKVDRVRYTDLCPLPIVCNNYNKYNNNKVYSVLQP